MTTKMTPARRQECESLLSIAAAEFSVTATDAFLDLLTELRRIEAVRDDLLETWDAVVKKIGYSQDNAITHPKEKVSDGIKRYIDGLIASVREEDARRVEGVAWIPVAERLPDHGNPILMDIPHCVWAIPGLHGPTGFRSIAGAESQVLRWAEMPRLIPAAAAKGDA